MPSIFESVPDADNLLAMEPEELGLLLLRDVNNAAYGNYGHQPVIKRGNYFVESRTPAKDYPPKDRQRVDEALMAAWVWLEREGLLLPLPDNKTVIE
jgi:hypothetical protein